jgi:diguanylate cyclase (GGDEF)-like protein
MPLVSLKRSLNELERLEELATASVDGLRGVFATLANHTLEIDPAAAGQLRAYLRETESALRREQTVERVQGARCGFEREWTAFAATSHSRYEQLCRELSVTVRALDEALTSASREVAGGAETSLRQEISLLNSLLITDDVRVLHAEIQACAARLNSCLEAFRKERLLLTAQLRDEIRTLQRHLEDAEREAKSDPVSGLINRREIERQVAAALTSGEPFAVLYVWIANYKYLERDLSRAMADALIAAISNAITASLPAGAPAGRWSDDEFYALVSDKASAMRISRDLSLRLNMPFQLNEGECSVKPRASVGVIEAEGQEDYSSFLKRAERLTKAIQGRN